jgi:hypothetical protein
MSDMRQDLYARWPWLYRQPIGVTRGGIATLVFACVAIFVCFFAVGRATVPANAPQLQASTGFALTYTGASVPTGLSGVPSIATTIDFPPARVRAASHTHAATAVPSRRLAAQTTSPPAAEAPSAVVTSPAVSAPARHPQHSNGGGGSFDSSG